MVRQLYYDRGWQYMNDLWRYDLATGMWTWMSGSDMAVQAGIYGTQGIPAAPMFPARGVAAIPGQTVPAICGFLGVRLVSLP